MLDRLLEWDSQTLIYLNNLGLEQYDSFWSVVTDISSWIPLYIVFFVLIYLKHPKKEAIFKIAIALLALGVILATVQLTKETVARLRPNNDIAINSLIRILKHPESFSFFSGHAATSFGMTTLVVLFLRKRVKWAWIFFIWPILFTWSRIYVGVHYPLDIIVGTLVGLLYALLFFKMYLKFILPKIQ